MRVDNGEVNKEFPASSYRLTDEVLAAMRNIARQHGCWL